MIHYNSYLFVWFYIIPVHCFLFSLSLSSMYLYSFFFNSFSFFEGEGGCVFSPFLPHPHTSLPEKKKKKEEKRRENVDFVTYLIVKGYRLRRMKRQ